MTFSPEVLAKLARVIEDASKFDEIRIAVDFPTDSDPNPQSPVVEFWSNGKLIYTYAFAQIRLQPGISGVRLQLGKLADGGLQGRLATDYKVRR